MANPAETSAGTDTKEPEPPRHRPDPAEASGGGEPESPEAPSQSLRWLRALGAVAFLVQLAVLIVRSQHQYAHFNESIDFAIFHQAWHQIAHGDLNPENTLFGYPYWRGHLEVIMWPLALLWWLHGSGVTLLWIQDLAMVAAEVVTYLWVLEAVARRPGRRGLPSWTLAVGALVLLLANPWIYSSLTQDFHFEALATLFVVAAARQLWKGRLLSGWILIAAAFLTGDVAGTYAAGVGLSLLLVGRPSRRVGAAVMVAGVGWTVFIAAIGANMGSAFPWYAYLAGRPTLQPGVAGVLAVAGGILRHPSRPLRALRAQRRPIYENLAPAGVLGLLNPLAAGIMVVVLVENGLNSNVGFIRPGYQNLPVYLFGALGTVVGIEWLARRRGLKIIAALLGLFLLGNAVWFTYRHSPSHLTYKTDGEVAAELKSASSRIAPDAEVIATFGVLGPFAGRRYIYPLAAPGASIPLRARTVVVVIAPTAGNQVLSRSVLLAVADTLRGQYHASPLHDGPNVFVFAWQPPPGMTSVVLLPTS